ncbi:Pantothenate transporter liz1 [Mycena kentingensis (nom. inval.)]|nr:Pantothenate transporter liz1 [Mycena kentingensis (nom. inval.)]
MSTSEKNDMEKGSLDLVEDSTRHSASLTESDFTPQEQAKIVRRIDWRLVSLVGIMYCASLMDRTNLSVANIAGMSVELKLTGNKYNIISLVFFPTYTIFQPPSTVLVRKFGPRRHLAAITLLWGAVMIGMGFVKNWEQLAALRVVLGILEAGFFPSCVYLLSTWYTRYEVGKRNAFFYLIGSMASAFAGILAYGLQQMNGLSGLTGWRWIFIIEGVLTCALAFIGYWLLVDFPDSTRKSWNFLSDRERKFIVAKVEADRGDVKPVPFNLRNYLATGADWKVWLYAMLFFNTTTITYALAYFLPIILHNTLGFSIAKSQCLVAPPYVLAAIVMYTAGALGDKYHFRGPIIVFNALLCVTGLPIIGWASSAAVRYFGIFLVTAGANANIPAVMSYQANNIRGQWKRAFCSATMVGFGGIGGIAGSLVFRSQDSPRYLPGLYACLACSLLNIVLVGVLSIAFSVENRKAARGEKELEAHEEHYQPGFRYTY